LWQCPLDRVHVTGTRTFARATVVELSLDGHPRELAIGAEFAALARALSQLGTTPKT
jgi:hypothetical protein